MSIDKQQFDIACKRVINVERERNGIGTLGEKTLHMVLKCYYEPDDSKHEVKIGRHVADICDGAQVTEIQTRNFDKMRKKLEAFLDEYIVTIVYPVPSTKWLLWIDEENGEVTQKRKSPKRGGIYELLQELYRIKPFLTHPNLRLRITLLDIEEYRYLNGWSKDKKKGSSRCDRIPVDIVDEVDIAGAADYTRFVPDALTGQFTVKDYKKAAKVSDRTAGAALGILHHMGAVKRVGKKGNAYLYERV